jgi:hypothetical protein
VNVAGRPFYGAAPGSVVMTVRVIVVVMSLATITNELRRSL